MPILRVSTTAEHNIMKSNITADFLYEPNVFQMKEMSDINFMRS